MNVKIKKKKAIDVDTEGSWAISYGDMITLLLSFFVIFFSFDFKEKDEKKLEGSVIKNVTIVESSNVSNGIDDKSFASQAIELEQIETIVKKDVNGDIVIFFKGANFFSSGSTFVNEYGKILLEKVSQKILPFAGKYKLKVQAFTDDQPVLNDTYRYRDNVELSALRSISVMRSLESFGIPSSRIEIGGKGIMSKRTLKLLGLVDTTPKETRRMSRTVALVLYREDAV